VEIRQIGQDERVTITSVGGQNKPAAASDGCLAQPSEKQLPHRDTPRDRAGKQRF
jgi:hypothetical protein